ncbi:hypothetical protein [Halobacteriovorax sp. DPLXC-1]|uniref:hypothetical protein n=1 Tax=Halobacteriovorax sp. DPLXC-1 TaxID=3110771 RepID=UPI002FF06C1E
MKIKNIAITILILGNLVASAQSLVSSKLPKEIQEICRASAQEKKLNSVPFMGLIPDELSDEEWEARKVEIANNLTDAELIDFIKNDSGFYRTELAYNSIFIAGDETETVNIYLSCNKGVLYGRTEMEVNMNNVLTQVFAAPALIRPLGDSKLAFTGNYARLPMLKAIGRSETHIKNELKEMGLSMTKIKGQIVKVDNKSVLFGKSNLGTPKIDFYTDNAIVLNYVTSNKVNNASLVDIQTYIYDYESDSIKHLNLK